MSRHILIAILLGVCFAGSLARRAGAQYLLEDVKDPKRYESGFIVFPFMFYTSAYRLGGGVVFSGTGLLQPQTDSFGLLLGSVNGSYGVQGGLHDLQVPKFDRLFFDIELAFFQENQFTAYLAGNPHFSHQIPGSNDSSNRDFFQTKNDDGWGHMTFKYLLPIGGGRDVVINRYRLDEGMLADGAVGGIGWNPFATGRTFLEITPRWEYQALESAPADLHSDTNGLEFGVIYDNSDFPLNPSRGNVAQLQVKRDFGLFNSSDSWTNISGEFTQYLNLGESRAFKQRVLSLDAWTSYSPTWHNAKRGGDSPRTAPPFYEGAVLGGNTHFRGFDDNRFHDRAALYGSAELRLVPRWNPFTKFKLLKEADITWMQWVLFAEIGRVANEYSPELLRKPKGDVGFGLRILAKDTLVRFDVAASSEGYQVWVGLGQPF